MTTYNYIERRNNFDFLRLIFAYFVILSHCYPISGEHDCDWLCQLTDKQIWFSFIGLKGFFAISGYLIFKSLHHSKSLKSYTYKRIYRIFPAFFTVLILTALLMSIIYQNDKVPYFSQPSVWSYVPINLSLIFYQLNIVNIFESNPYQYIINGSLWTIPYEVVFYCLLPIIKLRNIRTTKTLIILLFLISVLLSILYNSTLKSITFGSFQLSHLFDLLSYFLAGSLIYLLKLDMYFSKKQWILFFIFLITISIYFQYFESIKYFVFPLTIILIGNSSMPIINQVYNRVGDISFGLYLYAFPIQQTLYFYFKFNTIPLFIYSAIITTIFAILSWNLIEKRFMEKIKTKTN